MPRGAASQQSGTLPRGVASQKAGTLPRGAASPHPGTLPRGAASQHSATLARSQAPAYAKQCIALNTAEGAPLRKRPAAAKARRVAHEWTPTAVASAARLRAAATAVPWLCSPELHPHGVKCTRCPRAAWKPSSMATPSRFCTTSPCQSCAKPPPARERTAALANMLLFKPRGRGGAADVSRAQDLGLQVFPNRWANWECPLCDFRLPAEFKGGEYPRRAHLLSHGQPGRDILADGQPGHGNQIHRIHAASVIERRQATKRADYIERIRLYAEALPAWACQPVLTDEGLACSVCGFTAGSLSSFLRAWPTKARTRFTLTCSGAPEEALTEAAAMSWDACAAQLRDAAASATSQLREHSRQRNRDRRALLAKMRRGTLQC